MFYVSRGSLPPTRHTQHRAPDGSLYAEELFGVEGFTGRSSLLYHLAPPTRVTRIEPMGAVTIETADDGSHHHQLIDSAGLQPAGDAITGRIPLFHNADVVMGVVLPADADAGRHRSTATARATRCCSSTRARACSGRTSATSPYHPGDYLVLPIGTTWRLDPDEGVGQRMLYLECPSELEPPKRYRNDYGQLLEHSPVLAARHPHPRLPRADRRPTGSTGSSSVPAAATRPTTSRPTRSTSSAGTATCGHSRSTSRTSSRSPAASTSRRRSTRRSQARNFVVCSFVPRKFDYHPLAIPAPYNHSNINSDEVIYYVAGNFMSRRGVGIASFTLHPAGIPHGPHPGTVEASIGKEATEELAVMVDTFRPLWLTKQAAALENPDYPFTWLPAAEARRGSAPALRARPGGVPGLTRECLPGRTVERR